MNKLSMLLICLLSCLCFQAKADIFKPYNQLEISTANLAVYPKKINQYSPGTEITIGDLHGNALKLMFFLISTNTVQLSKANYKELVTIYKKTYRDFNRKGSSFFQRID